MKVLMSDEWLQSSLFFLKHVRNAHYLNPRQMLYNSAIVKLLYVFRKKVNYLLFDFLTSMPFPPKIRH